MEVKNAKESFTKVEIANKVLYACNSYVYHRRAKNWIAKILEGNGGKFKFNREFLTFETIDTKKYIELDPETIYHFRFTYYSGGGNPTNKAEDFFIIENGEFVSLTETQVLIRLSTPKDKLNILSQFTSKELMQEVKRRNIKKEAKA